MNWTDIPNSNALKAISYDAASYTLGVMTSNGTPYFYLDVPPEVHAKMLQAESKGKFWLSQIKPNYQCRKGDGALAQQSPAAAPVHPKVEKIITEPAAKAPVPPPTAEVLSLAISFESAGGIPTLPFESMVARLRTQMDAHCAALVTEIDDLAKRALALTVTDEASFTAAADLGKQLAEKRKYVSAMMKPPKQAIDSVKAVVLAKEHDLLTSAGAGEERLKRLCTDYRMAERKRAEDAAADERKRLLREAEDKRIREAEQAQATGRTKLADALLSTPVTAPKVEVKAAVPQGVATARVNWKWRVTDMDKIPREWLCLDESRIGAYVRENKDKTVIPGIEAYPQESTSF